MRWKEINIFQISNYWTTPFELNHLHDSWRCNIANKKLKLGYSIAISFNRHKSTVHLAALNLPWTPTNLPQLHQTPVQGHWTAMLPARFKSEPFRCGFIVDCRYIVACTHALTFRNYSKLTVHLPMLQVHSQWWRQWWRKNKFIEG